MDVLCCRITVGDPDPDNPMKILNGVEMTEVHTIEINESYKKLIGTAKVTFPKGSVCRSTIIGNVTLEGKDVSRLTTEIMEDGVLIEKRTTQRLVDETTFKIGQRINIMLGYNGVMKNMFDGYITGYNSDSMLEIQCENMAYKLKLKKAPLFETPVKGTTVNDVLEGKYNKEVYNRIAGWAFDHNHIWKNNISLSADGSITNGTKWKLNNDGSGQIASGNVSWNASGTVTFAASVSAQWTTGITNAKELASAMAFGKMLYRDPTFWEGNNSVAVYNNSNNGMVAITRVQDSTAPNDSRYVLKIQTNGTASPGNGGFGFGTTCSYRKVLIARIIAKIPQGRNLCWASNSIGSDGSSRWLTDTAGTGDWQEYIYKVVCGTSGFSSTHFFYVDGTQGTSSAPVVWYVAYATVFDLTSSEKSTTTIDANGIYTGTVRANQVLVDSALVVGGSTYNGSISVRDASNNVKVTLDRTGITAVAGKIGGWVLGTSSLTASAPSSGHRIVIGGSGYIYHDNPSTGKNYWALKTDGSAIFGTGKVSFASDGSGFVANGNFKWDANGNITAQKGTFKDVEVIGTIRNAFILSDSTIYIGGTDPQLNLNKYNNVVAIRDSWDVDIPLPWTLEQSGRRVCLVNYKWGSNTTIGTMSITAPSGKYFYEDGIAKSTISFSREVIELLGYGDNTTFFGWIVVNRLDIMTTKKYGSVCKFLVMGTVTVSSTSSISVKYRTFDGSTISVSRLGKGQYRVYMPSSWGLSGYYTVFLSGIFSTVENTPIYATLKETYSYYFDVYTQDDPTRNDGSFNFMVVSTGDWK